MCPHAGSFRFVEVGRISNGEGSAASKDISAYHEHTNSPDHPNHTAEARILSQCKFSLIRCKYGTPISVKRAVQPNEPWGR